MMPQMTVPEQVEEIIEKICDEYCKWPLIYSDERDDLKLDEKCRNCPLAQLR